MKDGVMVNMELIAIVNVKKEVLKVQSLLQW
jgi:hypothetical protein